MRKARDTSQGKGTVPSASSSTNDDGLGSGTASGMAEELGELIRVDTNIIPIPLTSSDNLQEGEVGVSLNRTNLPFFIHRESDEVIEKKKLRVERKARSFLVGRLKLGNEQTIPKSLSCTAND